METVTQLPTKHTDDPSTKTKAQHPSLSTPSPLPLTSTFRLAWSLSTGDNDLTLYGFSRFRTSHLLNLRFLEEEIRALDHRLFQAGFKLGIEPTESDKMWFRHGRVDENAEGVEDVVTRANVERLRGLLKEYDDALIAFNTVVNMETFALTDNMELARRRIDITPQEAGQTRLVRVDLPSGRSRDPLRGTLTRWFRGLRQRRLDRLALSAEATGRHRHDSVFNFKPLSQNTVLLTDMIARFLVAIAACVLLVVPLVILSYQERRAAHLVTVSVCIVVFSLLVSLASKASNQETMAAAAAYAAVLVVFVGSVPQPSR